MNVSEQRKSKRFELRLPFELISHGNRPLQEAGETRNLSSGGVLFTSKIELEIGSSIEYFITLQTGRNGSDSVRLHCMGKVVRRHDDPTIGRDDELVAMAATLERYEFVRPD